MSDRYLEILTESGLKGNYIPSGRQLPRTPPFMDVRKHLDFCNEEPNEAGTGDQDNNDQNRTFDFNTPETKTEPDDPNSMLRGMKGYQLTSSDLEFIKNMKEEKLIKQLQRDLEEVQRLLKKEMMAAELVCASREKALAELRKFPSCEELAEWAKVVLEITSPSSELTDLDAKSLLAMVTRENIQEVMDEKRIELTRMEKMVANKRKKEAKEKEQLEKQIASEQMKIQGLMSQLSDLKSELAQEEEAYKALELKINTQDAPEIKVEADASEELEATKSKGKRQAKERRKVIKSTEKQQDTINQSKSTRSKLTDSQTSGKDDRANKNTSETLKTKQKSGAVAETKSVKAARGPQKKVEKESNPPESEQAARRRKPPETAQRSQSKVKPGEAPSRSRQRAAVAAGDAGDAGEEAQSAVLRRSKRIASRR